MAKPSPLSLSIFLFLLSSGSCLGYKHHGQQQEGQQWQQFNECQIDNLHALEPDNRIDAEAGRIESWDPNHQQFRCAGVALMRITIERNGLYLPTYTNTHQLLYVVRGHGYFSVVIPGCAETLEESESESQQGGQGRRSQDRHQKIRHFREGDIVALPAGAAYWMYNYGDSPLVTVNLLDTNNKINQLDRNPRKFYLAGNPKQPFEQEQQQSRRGGQQGEGSNLFSGFDTEFLARIFNVNTETAMNLKGRNDNRNNIIRVQGGQLGVISPAREHGERWREEQYESRDNGLEETACSLRLRENIGDSSRSDVFNPQAGRLTTINSFTLPILNWFQLSAERGTLYRNGIFVPHWEMNAHSIIYGLRGRGRIQVVDHNGNNVFNGELTEGQVLTVPQNFAVAKQAQDEAFEYIAFKTNDNAMVSPLVGRTSALQGMPADVLANAFQIRTEEAMRLKRNPDVTLLSSSPSQSRRQFDA